MAVDKVDNSVNNYYCGIFYYSLKAAIFYTKFQLGSFGLHKNILFFLDKFIFAVLQIQSVNQLVLFVQIISLYQT